MMMMMMMAKDDGRSGSDGDFDTLVMDIAR